MRVSSHSGDVEGEGFPRLLPSAPWPPYLLPPHPHPKRKGLGAGPRKRPRGPELRVLEKKNRSLKTRRAAQCGATTRPRDRRAEPLAGRARPCAVVRTLSGAARCSGRPGRTGHPRHPAAESWRGAARRRQAGLACPVFTRSLAAHCFPFECVCARFAFSFYYY